MSLTSIRNGDVLVVGADRGLDLAEAHDFRATVELAVVETLSTKVKVIVIAGAPGLFEVLRKDFE